MAWMGSAAGLGVMVGPALGGMFAEVNLPRTFRFEHLIFDAFSVPFFAAGILALLSLSATVIWLKEPQTPNANRKSIPLIKAFLIPIIATMVSRRSVTGAGAGLGMQNAVNSLGQAIGPVAGGLLFTLSIHLPYLLAGILLLGSTGLLKIPIWGKTNEELESLNS